MEPRDRNACGYRQFRRRRSLRDSPVQLHRRDRIAPGARAVDAGDLRGKTLVDVANPLDFSRGMPPTLTVCNTDSLGEQIQRAYPATKVVKALNTVNSDVMVDPALVEGDHMLLTCGNDAGAKAEVSDLLARAFGWKPENIIDLGDITAARGTEAFLLLWVRLMGTLGTAHFNLRIAPPALVEQVIADAPSRAPL
jgi:predicted dinucleotide-binding enzyme